MKKARVPAYPPSVFFNPLCKYGGCSLQTRLSRDQLDRADAGSWQIADRYATAS